MTRATMKIPPKNISELWMPISGYVGLYSVSNFGRVRSFDRTDRNGRRRKGKILKTATNPDGYQNIGLHRDGILEVCKVARLVARAFLQNPDGKPQVNHINGIKSDDRVVNLEWVTCQENTRHAWRTGLTTKQFGEAVSSAVLNRHSVAMIRSALANGESQTALSRKFGVHQTTIYAIKISRTWK